MPESCGGGSQGGKELRDRYARHPPRLSYVGMNRQCLDNTNRDTTTRKLYVDLAKKVGARVRCFLFEGSMDLAWHNNLYRAYNQPPSNGTRVRTRHMSTVLSC